MKFLELASSYCRTLHVLTNKKAFFGVLVDVLFSFYNTHKPSPFNLVAYSGGLKVSLFSFLNTIWISILICRLNMKQNGVLVVG